MQVSHIFQTATAVFDDERLVANAGAGLVSLAADQLGLETVADDAVTVGYRAGRKLLTSVVGMSLGADCIDDLDILRSGATERVLGFKPLASETIGQWLRSFNWGTTLQLGRVLESMLKAAWDRDCGPGDGPMTIDIDSSICEVYGRQKQGAEWSYTSKWAYHPIFAHRADTGEVLHAWLRGGSAHTARAAATFIRQAILRSRRCGASGKITVRCDSGFYVKDVVKTCRTLKCDYSIGCKMTEVSRDTITTIQEHMWKPIKLAGETAHVAEGACKMPGVWGRLIVRRVKRKVKPEVDPDQLTMFDGEYMYLGFVTNRVGDPVELDADHRKRAVQELSIRELKDNALAHLPSGNFAANCAWTWLACISHNLIRFIAAEGLGIPGLVVARTIRKRYFTVPARITRSARKTIVHLPKDWPWEDQWLRCLRRVRGAFAPC